MSIPIAVPTPASGHSVTFTLVLNGSGDTASTLAVASLTPDPDPTNNSATAASPVVLPASTGLDLSTNHTTFGQAVTITTTTASVFL